MAGKTVVVGPGEGTALWLLGGLYEVKTTAEETGGAMTVMEMTLPTGAAPPPHTHPGGEAVYVLEGNIRYHIGDDVVEAETGSFFSIPEGTLEWFEPTGDTPARLLVIYTPGGIDKFFTEVAEPASVREIPPPSDSSPDLERIVSVASQYGMEIVPPEA